MPALSDSTILAVNTGSFWPATTQESIRLLQEVGLPDVELTLQPNEFRLTFHRELHMPLRPALEAMAESGTLRVCSIHAPQIGTEHGYSLRARGEYLAHTLETCHLLGARIVVVHPFHLFGCYEETLGYLRGDISNVWNTLLPDAPALLERARAADVVVALENVKVWNGDEFFNTPANVRRFLDDVAHPSLGFTFDVVHGWWSECLNEFLDTLGHAVVNLHVADVVPPIRRVPPGEGTLPWTDLIPTLKRLPHLRQVTVELTRAGPEAVARAAGFLTHCWSEAP